MNPLEEHLRKMEHRSKRLQSVALIVAVAALVFDVAVLIITTL